MANFWSRALIHAKPIYSSSVGIASCGFALVGIVAYALSGRYTVVTTLAFFSSLIVLLALPCWPRFCSVFIIVIWALFQCYPGYNGSSILIWVLFAWSVVVALGSIPLCAIVMFSLTAFFSGYFRFNGFDAEQVLVSCSTSLLDFMLSGLVGLVWRHYRSQILHREQAIIHAHEKQRLLLLQRDVHLASQMHDTITNNLTYIMTVAQTQLDFASCDDDGKKREIWKTVFSQADNALDRVHQVIRILDRSEKENQTSNFLGAEAVPVRQFSNDLVQLVETEEKQLSKLGYHGLVNVETNSVAITMDSVGPFREVRNLVVELFANLRRHCLKSDDYLVTVQIGSTSIEISQMNSIDSHTSRSPVIGKSGKGLSFHKEIVEKLGGVFRTNVSDSTWTCYVSIPLMPPELLPAGRDAKSPAGL